MEFYKSKCTACDRTKPDLEYSRSFPNEDFSQLKSHPLLNVPICNNCDFIYNSGTFEVDTEGNEIFCRWCGDGSGNNTATGGLLLCDECPKSFCKKCIKRNFGLDEINSIELSVEPWSCYICNSDYFDKLCKKQNLFVNSEVPVSTVTKDGTLIYGDISKGREKNAVPVYNDVDSDGPPLEFTYVANSIPG
jgi:hypothetical protein